MARATIRHRVQFGETDAAGVVFFPNYFRWFDRATHELFRELGYPVTQMVEDGWAVYVRESYARFLAPVQYDDELEIRSDVVEVRTRGFRVSHVVVRADQIICEGHEVRVWAAIPAPHEIQLRPAAIPDDVRALLTASDTR